MEKYIIGILLSIFLLSGCVVSDKEYQDSQTGLNQCAEALIKCRNKECPECICEETTEEIEEPYFEECPYDCGEYRECKSIYDGKGNLRNWQCILKPFQ